MIFGWGADCREKKADKVKDDILNSPTPTRNVEAASVGKSVSDDQPLSRWLVQSPSVDGHGTGRYFLFCLHTYG